MSPGGEHRPGKNAAGFRRAAPGDSRKNAAGFRRAAFLLLNRETAYLSELK